MCTARAIAVACLLHAAAAQALADVDHTRIVVMDADGSNKQALARIEPYRQHNLPRWSPDGREIAFDASWKTSGEYDPRIFKVSATGGEPVDMGPGKTPSWSPDGAQIVFRIPPEVDGAQRAGVWIMNADGKGREYLFPGFQPVFSPDGGRLSYTSEGQTDLHVYEMLEGTHRKIRHPYVKIVGYAAWSPDGTRLCFIGKKENGENELAITTADGAQDSPDVYWNSPTLVRFPSWAPDEKILLTLRTAVGSDRVYSFDPKRDKEPRILAQQPSALNYDAAYSPDRKKIVFVTDFVPNAARQPAQANVDPFR